MMLPNQINSQRFALAGKGGYKAADVDAFIQKVYQNYNKLYNDNNILRERLSAITPLIDEYNENKKAIANALIWAQTTSDNTVNTSKIEAEKIMEEAKAEAERFLASKIAQAEAVYAETLKETADELETAKAELARVKNETIVLSEKYIEEINKKAKEIVEDANMKASQIVASAYSDAKSARENADAVLLESKKQLKEIKGEIASFKLQAQILFKTASEELDNLRVGEEDILALSEGEEIKAEQIDIDTIPAFDVDFSASEEEVTEVAEEATDRNIELISASANAEMPDVSSYISKIFDSVGKEDNDFSSFADDLNGILATSLEGTGISFEDIEIDFDEVTSDSE